MTKSRLLYDLLDFPLTLRSVNNSRKIIDKVGSYTMKSTDRIKALLDAVTYLTKNYIKGDVVECGTWKGGSIMAILEKLMFHGDRNRKIWVFDTFEGMTSPEDHDVDLNNIIASVLLDKTLSGIDFRCISHYEEATANIMGTGYPAEKLEFIKGDVVKTLPTVDIANIALLHLDTDWYASTKAEMEHLYPKLVKGGILMIDDYGHWKGCRKAVDEYFELNEISIKMVEIDYTARMIIKD